MNRLVIPRGQRVTGTGGGKAKPSGSAGGELRVGDCFDQRRHVFESLEDLPDEK